MSERTRRAAPQGRPRQAVCTEDHRPAWPCRQCAAARARAFRRRRPDLATAAEQRRTDERRRLERAARAYLATYLRRGRVMPATQCDACGAYSERLRPWHPDPLKKREIAWLCSEHRRIVPAAGEPVTLHWTWPGLGVPPPRPRWARFACAPEAIAAAVYAVQRAQPPIRAAADRHRRFVDAFLAIVGQQEREALLAVGLHAGASWAPYGNPELDAHLRAWIERERRQLAHERFGAPFEEVGEAVPRFGARERRNRYDRPAPQRPPEQKKTGAVSRPVLDESQLDRLSASAYEEVDAILARVQAALATNAPRARPPQPDAEDLD